MERWEIIERYVLLGVGAALLAVAGWLGFFRTGPERLVALVLLAPCVYWVFWQALYEDKIGTDEPPSRGERFMHALWVWSRRLLLGGISGLLAFGAFAILGRGGGYSDWGVVAIFGLLSFMAAWVAVFGGGRHASTSDDRRVHHERMGRYKE